MIPLKTEFWQLNQMTPEKKEHWDRPPASFPSDWFNYEELDEWDYKYGDLDEPPCPRPEWGLKKEAPLRARKWFKEYTKMYNEALEKGMCID